MTHGTNFFTRYRRFLVIILIWTLSLLAIGYFFIGSISNLMKLITESWGSIVDNLLPGMLGISFLYTIVLIIRTVRWQSLLKHQSYDIKIIFLAKVVWVAWAINSVTTPLRIGEVQRAYLLKRNNGIPYSITASSIILEKFFDLFGLFFILAIGTMAISFQFRILNESINIIFWLGIFILFISLFILSMMIFDEKYLALLERLPLKKKIVRLYLEFKEARKSLIRAPKQFLFILCISIMQWLIEALTILWIARLFNFGTSVHDGIAITFGAIVGYASFILPISPGSFGPFEFSVAYIVSLLLNIELEAFLQVPLVTHVYVVFYLAITGIFALFALKFEKKMLANNSFS